MREEYDIRNLDPRENPYTNKLKKQITIDLDNEIIEYFKDMSKCNGIPYQILISLYLSDCVNNNRRINLK